MITHQEPLPQAPSIHTSMMLRPLGKNLRLTSNTRPIASLYVIIMSQEHVLRTNTCKTRIKSPLHAILVKFRRKTPIIRSRLLRIKQSATVATTMMLGPLDLLLPLFRLRVPQNLQSYRYTSSRMILKSTANHPVLLLASRLPLRRKTAPLSGNHQL